jgi:cellulose biosynthesis protein BcsQ
MAAEVVHEITQQFPKEKFQSMIPTNMRLSEAPSYGLTILEHDARSPGALAYKALAEEVIERATSMEAWHAKIEQPTTESSVRIYEGFMTD